MKPPFPIFLDLTDRLVVLVGSGTVGHRRLEGLLHTNARIRVVTLESKPRDLEHATNVIEWRQEAYRSEHLEGAFLVLAAANAEIDRQVLQDSRAKGILCNVADADNQGDFQVPARVERGRLQIAISTGGVAPHLAKELREQLDKEFDSRWGIWLDIIAWFREQAQTLIADTKRRETLLRSMASRQGFEQFTKMGQEEYLEWLRSELAQSPCDPLQ
jgi:siroheme synthase-like protein